MFDKYQIRERIHHGARTDVFRAERISDKMPVILKVRDLEIADQNYGGLDNEFQLAKTFPGDYTVRYLSYDIEHQKVFLVMDDDNLTSLTHLIPGEGLELFTFLHLAITIVSAVEELHSFKIIHKDLNPSNIIANPAFDTVKIIDFDFSSLISEELVSFEPPNVLQGTLAYISPEQTGRVNKPVDRRSDLYSLGITFYQLLTGAVPFVTTNPGDLIYAHIARLPRPVSEIKEDIPRALSLVIDTLLKKSSRDRYQSAAALKKDLIFIRDNVQNGRGLEGFIPGEQEKEHKIVLSNKLYGRDKEKKILCDSLEKSAGSVQIVTVTGEAGIGKTALIRELYTPITSAKGFFISGKFDLLNRGFAYIALANALKEFVKQCLGQDEDTINLWRRAVRSSVGRLGKVLTDIVPEFEQLIGQQQKIASVTPFETTARLGMVFSTLITDICALGTRLILFLDDLQWADLATLELLAKILDNSPKNLLIIFAFRDKEVTPAHPAGLFLEGLMKKNQKVIPIHLKNLLERDIQSWLFDILPCRSAGVHELSQILISKTEGNPFFMLSLLQTIIEKDYLSCKDAHELTVNIKGIKEIATDSGVVEHLIDKISNLKPDQKTLLNRLSILGSRFTITIINAYLQKSLHEYFTVLIELIKNHLLIKSGETIFFAHDRIQQAARKMIDDKQAAIMHLQAARNIKAALDGIDGIEEHLDTYIHHFNAAHTLIKNEMERMIVAGLNIKMGKKLSKNAAFNAAKEFFEQALSFMPENLFAAHYDMAIDLYTDYGETLFLNHKYEEGERFFDDVVRHSKSPLDTIRVQVIRQSFQLTRQNLYKSMEIIVSTLENLGIKLPGHLHMIQTIVDLIKTKFVIGSKKAADMLELPRTGDPLVLAQMKMMSAATATIFSGFPEYFPIIILKMMRITEANGICEITPDAYLAYAIILISLGDIEGGCEYGKAALALMEKHNYRKLFTKMQNLYTTFIHHWQHSAREGIKKLERAILSGFETGDYESASYAVINKVLFSYFYGKSLSELFQQFPGYLKILKGFGHDAVVGIMHYVYQLLHIITDPDADEVTVSGPISDEKTQIEFYEKNKVLAYWGIVLLLKLINTTLAQRYELGIEVLKRTKEIEKAMMGTFCIPIFRFFAALTYIGYYKKIKKRGKYLKKARKILRYYNKLATLCSENYLHKSQLLEAEIMSAEHKKQVDTLVMYETAIASAAFAGNCLDHGIACELMGRYLLKLGIVSLGRIKIMQSISVFEKWGHHNKSHHLAREFNIEKDGTESDAGTSSVFSSSTSFLSRMNLDALSESIQSLTGKLNLRPLLEKLLDITMKNSGATRVVYIQVTQDTMQVKAEKQGSEEVYFYSDTRYGPGYYDLPETLITECCREKQQYILENIPVKIDNEHAISFKSVLLIPLKRNETVTGLIYLENNLLENAFRADQIKFISLLAGQTAIAIENAAVFEQLSKEKNFSTNLIQNTPSLICGIDKEGIATFVNSVVEKVTGYSNVELIGANWWTILFPDKEHSQVDKLFQKLETAEISGYEMVITCKNGEKRVIIWTSITSRDENGKPGNMTIFGVDITDRKKTQALMIQSEKMLSVGGLAAGLAHEINNPLAGMLQVANILQSRLWKQVDMEANKKVARKLDFDLEGLKEFVQGRGIPELLAALIESGQRIADIITNMLDFARKSDGIKSTYDLQVIVDKTLELANTEYDLKKNYDFKSIKIVKEYDTSLPPIPCEAGKIQQVLLNLFRNGAQAMQDGNRRSPCFIIRLIFDRENKTACIEIEDNGPGIDEATAKRIFEPFFTTKSPGVGTGLGLSVSYFIITEHHGGQMSVESAPGGGAKFIIKLPMGGKAPPGQDM